MLQNPGYTSKVLLTFLITYTIEATIALRALGDVDGDTIDDGGKIPGLQWTTLLP
jgi:hypothetical protein